MYINNKYNILEQIGSGAFGSIYKGKNIRTNENVAIKIESINSETKLLKNESTIYQYLINTPGIPTVKWFGKDEQNYYMVINLLGESLQNLKDRKEKLSLKLTLQIGIQILQLLETIHNKGLVHRDIKPENFLLGLNNYSKQIYIIDFGFCKSFMNGNNHIPIKKTNNLIGSLSYASINSHKCIELSRRDDLESLGYMLIYFFNGKLEWQELQLFESREKENKIIEQLKTNIIESNKISGIFLNYLKHVRSLEFDEKPNYSILTDMFKREINLL